MNTGITYLASSFYVNKTVERYNKKLVDSTGNKMGRVFLTGSGSEAMESVMKLGRQYFYELNNDTPRVNFIARNNSYHGNTLGALSVSGFISRKAPYLPLLPSNVYHISSCNAYRQQLQGESNAYFVIRKAAELEAKFQELGPNTVIVLLWNQL